MRVSPECNALSPEAMMLPMNTPRYPSPRSVLAARVVLSLLFYVPLVALLRSSGRDWTSSLSAPLVLGILAWTGGSLLSRLMITAAGLPTLEDEDSSRPG